LKQVPMYSQSEKHSAKLFFFVTLEGPKEKEYVVWQYIKNKS